MIGICECGHEVTFDYNEDFDFNDKNRGYKLKTPYICPECNKTYDRLRMAKKEREKSNNNTTIGLFIVSIVFIGSILFGIASDDSDPTYYDTGDPNDMNQEELEDYIEWQDKQNQKEFDKQKVYD